MMEIKHISVMEQEVVQFLKPEKKQAWIIDATLGEGGHSRALLDAYPESLLVGLEIDPVILKKAQQRLIEQKQRCRFYNTWFDVFFKDYPLSEKPDAILMDLGISMHHYLESKRGFSFVQDEWLDMRLDPNQDINAAVIIRDYTEQQLTRLFFELGEERFSKRIAARIVSQRKTKAIQTAKELAEIIKQAVPQAYRYGRIHPATRVFQALRIQVNKELERLQSGLQAALECLAPGGKLAVISFHSLEDRIVKHCFKNRTKPSAALENTPMTKGEDCSYFTLLTKKPVYPSEEEVQHNSASRSAKLRVIQKVRTE